MFIPLQSLPIHRFKRSRPFEGLRNAEAAGILPSEYEASDAVEGEDEIVALAAVEELITNRFGEAE